MHNSIFQTGWWLDAVAPGNWRLLEVRKGDHVVATMPVVLKRKYGRSGIVMPPLTQFLGPWLAPPEAGTKYPTWLGQQKELFGALIDALPACDYFSQKFHPEIHNWQPFYWRGFSATVRYTYILEGMTDLDTVMSGFQENIRRDIRKAEKAVTVEVADGVSELMEVSRKSLARAGHALPYSPQMLERVHAVLRERNAGRVLVARDKQGAVHAAMLYCWDDRCTSYVIGGGDPQLRNSGATSLLKWHAIQHAAALNGTFDFEGSMIEAVERFVRAFGGRQVPYFHVTRSSKALGAAMALRKLMERGRGSD
jgi:hypothetical protein